MTVDQQELPAIATTRDRATMLTILSGELSQRLSRHPIPPRIIVPLPAAPPRRRWLIWVRLPAMVGLIAATVTIVLLDFRGTQPVEKPAGSTDLSSDDVAVGPILTAAFAATPEASTADTPIVAPPAVADANADAPTQAAPAVHPANRELTSTEVRELQAKLRALKFEPGPLDGIKGPLTSGGVRRFQESHGLPATGVVDLAVLDEVREASATAD